MGTPFRAVLFDMDGVLVESQDAWFHLLQDCAQRLSCPAIDRATFDASFGQGVEADVAQFFPTATAEALETLYARHFLDHRAHVQVNPDARPVLEALTARGRGTAVVTNTPTELAAAILEGVRLGADVVFGPGDGLAEKPAPDLVLAACEALEVNPAEVLFVGDSRYDAEAAAAAGATFVGYRRPGDHQVFSLRAVVDLAEGL